MNEKVCYKFYDLETLTQDDLNNLALERNTFAKEIERLNNIITELENALKSHQYIKINAHYGEYYVEIDEVLNYINKLKEGKR